MLKPVGGTAALIIPEGAHHLDLRAANPLDPVSVVDARKKERYADGRLREALKKSDFWEFFPNVKPHPPFLGTLRSKRKMK